MYAQIPDDIIAEYYDECLTQSGLAERQLRNDWLRLDIEYRHLKRLARISNHIDRIVYRLRHR